jgi:YidC/Oxa1 family membrane protein insertase
VEKRLLIFLPVAFAIFYCAMWVDNTLHPRKPVAQNIGGNGAADKGAGNKAAVDKAAGDKGPKVDAGGPAKVGANEKNAVPGAPAAPPVDEAKQLPEQFFALGSVAPPGKENPYEMLPIFTSRGAAVVQIELADPRYRDLSGQMVDGKWQENRFGYLGYLALVADKDEKGCRVNVVGDGTPAAIAGLKVGDAIVEFDGKKTPTPDALFDLLTKTTPSQTVEITVRRGGATQKLSAALGRRPLAVIRPEIDTEPVEPGIAGKHDPLSFLLTLREADDDEIAADADKVDGEIEGLHLRTDNWQGKMVGRDAVEFTHPLPKWKLEVVKRYQLARLSADKPDQPAYHLMLHVEIRNTDDKAHSVAYQLDGPTGLPTEGWWYASRISPEWGAVALKNVALMIQGNSAATVNSMPLADQKFKAAEAKADGKEEPKSDESSVHKLTDELPLLYAGVDAQYFASILLPQQKTPNSSWLAEVRPLVLGEVPKDLARRKKIDVTCRLTSVVKKLEPKGSLEHEYQVFVGPKLPSLLEQYSSPIDPADNLGGLVYYGWFGWVSRPMVAVLEFFHAIVGNYGLSIIMLTVLVRLCMFPLSRKQAMSAKKMQELQPEMKKINEKYKTNPQEKTRATQELWRKHNYNPLGGCLLVFVQLPIFMGLYRSLMVNVQLRQASLLGEAARWCSNLSAPDMFWNWNGMMPDMLAAPTGWLGPFLNILPLATVGLFIWQQTLFMPPATDENTALQQKIMKYMTLFMGVMFFKVAAGLCLYFIASSLWGIGERKLLPKMTGAAATAADGSGAARPVAAPGANGNAGSKRKKQRGRR